MKNYTQYSVRKRCMKTNNATNVITLPQNKFSPNSIFLEHHLNGAYKTIYNGALWWLRNFLHLSEIKNKAEFGLVIWKHPRQLYSLKIHE